MTDILDLIDQAVDEPAASCWQCRGPLGASVSDDFCSQDCQTAWHAERSEPLVGYSEPYDVSAHYSRQPELDETLDADFVEQLSHRLRPPLSQNVASMARGAHNGTITYSDIVRMYQRLSQDLSPRARSFRFTQDQWDEIRSAIPTAPADVRDPTGSMLFATPIQLVDRVEDSTPYQQRWPGTYTINTGAWSTRSGIVYNIPTRGRCLITGPHETSAEDFTRGIERRGEFVGLDPAGQRIIVTAEFLDQACTQVPLDAQLIGGARHGETLTISIQAPDRIDLPVQVTPLRFPDAVVEFRRDIYLRHHCDGRRWYYFAERTSEPRTIDATERHRELTVWVEPADSARDQHLVWISDGDSTLTEVLPGELVADEPALTAWFLARRTAFVAQAEGDAYAEAEQREPGVLARRREALRPWVGDVVDTMSHEALYGYEQVRVGAGLRIRELLRPTWDAAPDRRLYEGNWPVPDRAPN